MSPRRDLIVCCALVAATLAVYGQALGFEFVLYDDDVYVTGNPHIQQGITPEAIRWAFEEGYFFNWHPLTSLSHMLDVQLFGLDPAGHHATSVLLHLINSLLLFGVLRSMTRALWPSAFAAALFALHPLHVESVAWVSERKDVLSAFFGFLAIGSYTAYARRGGVGRYLATFLLLAMGLLAKPMLVTLPLVFLLLDYWPLDRVGGEQRSMGRLLLEKVPLLLLSALSSAVTYAAQRSAGSVAPLGGFGELLDRLGNAAVAYVWYLGKAIWPTGLCALYPSGEVPGSGGVPWAGWQVAGATALLVAVSALVHRARRRRYPVVGWLWYLGTLVPVIGLVRVGELAMADRYTYLPLIGPFLVVAWGGSDLVSRLRRRRPAFGPMVAGLAVSLLVASAVRSGSQARTWRDSVSLFEHALAVVPSNTTAHNNLGNALRERGRIDEAIDHYRAALRMAPHSGKVRHNLVNALVSKGEIEEAIAQLRASLELAPDSALTHTKLGLLLSSRGELDRAVEHHRRAVALDPGRASLRRRLEEALRRRDALREAP